MKHTFLFIGTHHSFAEKRLCFQASPETGSGASELDNNSTIADRVKALDGKSIVDLQKSIKNFLKTEGKLNDDELQSFQQKCVNAVASANPKFKTMNSYQKNAFKEAMASQLPKTNAAMILFAQANGILVPPGMSKDPTRPDRPRMPMISGLSPAIPETKEARVEVLLRERKEIQRALMMSYGNTVERKRVNAYHPKALSAAAGMDRQNLSVRLTDVQNELESLLGEDWRIYIMNREHQARMQSLERMHRQRIQGEQNDAERRAQTERFVPGGYQQADTGSQLPRGDGARPLDPLNGIQLSPEAQRRVRAARRQAQMMPHSSLTPGIHEEPVHQERYVVIPSSGKAATREVNYRSKVKADARLKEWDQERGEMMVAYTAYINQFMPSGEKFEKVKWEAGGKVADGDVIQFKDKRGITWAAVRQRTPGEPLPYRLVSDFMPLNGRNGLMAIVEKGPPIRELGFTAPEISEWQSFKSALQNRRLNSGDTLMNPRLRYLSEKYGGASGK
jgi:hypothetical protein